MAASMRLANAPWKKTWSSMRAWIVGITNGCPSLTNPMWQVRASSRIAWIAARSKLPRCGSRRCVVRSVGGMVAMSSLPDANRIAGHWYIEKYQNGDFD
jgi:hypothetical protein